MSSPPTPITTSLDGKISPSVLLIIAILSIIFFLSGLIHLLIRFLLRPPAIDHDRTDTVTALQGQLQQLFHLHDAGVDQSYIDTLPVFFYKSVVGVKGPFDCAVCLCEFEPDDKLRLLPKCSHAFHIECIDTWLLSHSTCPLCRGTLVPEISPGCSPVVLVLESGEESSAEIVPDPSIDNSNSGPPREDEAAKEAPPEEKVVSVKLGKFRNLDVHQEGCSTSGDSTKNLDGRRCFSMGSFEYVMDEKATLRVAIKPPEKKSSEKNRRRSRLAMSECDFQYQRDGFIGFDKKSVVKRESFSVSKTWLRPKEGGSEDRSTRTFSFRKQKEGSRAWSEFDSGSEFDVDVEAGSCNNGRVLSRREECPSFARRTLLWVMGRNHKVGNHVGFG